MSTIVQFFVSILISFQALGANTSLASLSQISIKKESITVSGISAGAFMAVQLGVSHSSLISGVGSFAGGIYSCSEGSLVNAQIRCMAFPERLVVTDFLQLTEKLQSEGKIDSIANLKKQKVFVFSGTEDSVVKPAAGTKLTEFYSSFGLSNPVKFVKDVRAGHGQPTVNQGVSCTQPTKPWILSCGYDGAKEVLESLYGRLKEKGSYKAENLIAFEQGKYAGPEALMNEVGHVYIPRSCKEKNSECRLHLALHGCQQSPDWAEDTYRVLAGYNEWAETNNIVVLYPSVKKSAKNSNSCWDWWGYTGPEFGNQQGHQVIALRNMIRAISGY